jgi:hypothetical protein
VKKRTGAVDGDGSGDGGGQGSGDGGGGQPHLKAFSNIVIRSINFFFASAHL